MECSICLKIIQENEKYKTQCNHIFHRDCINRWLMIKQKCPYCRCNVVIDNNTKYMLFHDNDKYYFNNNGNIEILLKQDIDLIERYIFNHTNIYEKIDIILCFIKNNCDVVDTIIELIGFLD